MLNRVVLTRATRRNIPEGTILHIHRRENLKSYIIKAVSSKSDINWVYATPNRNEYQEYCWGKPWPALKAENFTAICEPTA
jgi:hypothetical protein